jgi:hypothetical protein
MVPSGIPHSLHNRDNFHRDDASSSTKKAQEHLEDKIDEECSGEG